LLLMYGAASDMVNEFDKPPLYYAITNKNFDMVRLLLKYKADPYAADKSGRNAYNWAAQVDSKLVQVLSGKDKDEVIVKAHPDTTSIHDDVKVSISALKGNLPETKTPNRNAVALIIGNKNYSREGQLPDVSFSVNDAILMKAYAHKTLGIEEGNIIMLTDAKQSELVKWFGNEHTEGRLATLVKPGVTELFVYYSGHGAPDLQTGKPYIVPVDASMDTLNLNGYSLDLLKYNLAKTGAKKVTMVLESCFSGGAGSGQLFKNMSPAMLVTREIGEFDGNLFAAAQKDQVASWDSETKLGIFTRYFIQGVNGEADSKGNHDGKVTAGELRSYLSDEVTYQARRSYNRVQSPKIQLKNSGEVMSSI